MHKIATRRNSAVGGHDMVCGRLCDFNMVGGHDISWPYVMLFVGGFSPCSQYLCVLFLHYVFYQRMMPTASSSSWDDMVGVGIVILMR